MGLELWAPLSVSEKATKLSTDLCKNRLLERESLRLAIISWGKQLRLVCVY